MNLAFDDDPISHTDARLSRTSRGFTASRWVRTAVTKKRASITGTRLASGCLPGIAIAPIVEQLELTRDRFVNSVATMLIPVVNAAGTKALAISQFLKRFPN
jgi:hypothetical protein